MDHPVQEAWWAHAPWAGAPLGGVEWIALGLLVAYLTLAEPGLGERFFAGFRKAGNADRERWFARLVMMQAAALGVALLLVWVFPAMSPARAGLVWGRPPSGVALGMVAGALGGMILGALLALRKDAGGDTGPAPAGDFQVLLPRNRRERGWLVAVAVGAGTGEELIYRGLLPALLVGAGMPLGWAVLSQGLLFGLAHRYQGAGGVLATAMVGIALGALTAHTGSLLLPMLLHTIMDLRLAASPSPEPVVPPPSDPRVIPPG